MTATTGELELACTELNPALEFLRGLGLRLDVIYPADDPHTAVLSHKGTIVRLTTKPGAPPLGRELPAFEPDFVLTGAGGGSGEGRAGMFYRDLIPGRLGGRYIASHITMAEGGPVSDWVHYHRVAFQMIFVAKGWVRVVYEDQGEPFVMEEGDLVLQPPGIRHRVLESAPGLEVVEISCPALHETFADHELSLPNAKIHPLRVFSGQRFLRHRAAEARWTPFLTGEAQETGMEVATDGLAQVRILRGSSTPLEFPPHRGELVFGFVLGGSAKLVFGDSFPLASADAFAIPPNSPWAITNATSDFRLLHVVTSSIG